MLIMVGFILMMGDCILNTMLLNKGPLEKESSWDFQCDLSIIVIVVFLFGIMMVYFARMWRVYRVFLSY